MPIVRRGDGRKLIVPAGVPEFLVSGIGLIVPAGQRYATSYFYREEPALMDFTELLPELVAVVKITWPYAAAPDCLEMTQAAMIAAGFNPEDLKRIRH